jgi:hypothetical protein
VFLNAFDVSKRQGTLFNFVQEKVCSFFLGPTVPSTSFSGITQSAENSDFEEVDKVREARRKKVYLFGSTMRVT